MSTNNKTEITNPLIIGHYGGCNTGDEAMLAGLLSAVEPRIRQHTTVVVKEGIQWNSYANLGPRLIPADLVSVLRALLKADGLVLGGGTHFHDDYTSFRYLRHCRHMWRIVGLSIIAKLMGRKVTWLGMGFGPFFRRPTEWVTRLGLMFCDRVTVRDAASLREIVAWIPHEKLALAFDLSALMVGNSHGLLRRPQTESYKCRTLGVSVTSVRQFMTGGPQVDETLRLHLASALSRILDSNPELSVRVMVIRGGNREDDTTVSLDLYKAISRNHPNQVVLVPYHPAPAETFRRILECDAFIATRYHACVLAYLSDCRLLFLAYHRKVQDLAGEIGLADEACINFTDPISAGDLVKRLERMIAGDQAFRARLPVSDAARRACLSIRTLQKETDLDNMLVLTPK